MSGQESHGRHLLQPSALFYGGDKTSDGGGKVKELPCNHSIHEEKKIEPTVTHSHHDGSVTDESCVDRTLPMSKKKGTRNMARTDTIARLKEPLGSSVETEDTVPENRDEVAALAYKLWQERGSRLGSDQEDWFRAKNELNNRKPLVASAAG